MIRPFFVWLICCMPLFADLRFEHTRREVVSRPEGEILKVEFPFRNDGSEAVTISRYDSGCGCLSGKLDGEKTVYAAGESGKVLVEVDSTNLLNVVEKQLGIWVQGKNDQPAATLTIQVTVPELIRVEPRTLRWNAGEQAASKSMVVTFPDGQLIHVTGVAGGDDSRFTRTLKVLEEGKRYEVIVTPKADATAGVESFRIETDYPTERLRSKVAFLSVSGSLIR